MDINPYLVYTVAGSCEDLGASAASIKIAPVRVFPDSLRPIQCEQLEPLFLLGGAFGSQPCSPVHEKAFSKPSITFFADDLAPKATFLPVTQPCATYKLQFKYAWF